MKLAVIKRTKLQDLKIFLDNAYGFDISRKTAKREVVYARKVFIQVAVKYGAFTLRAIGSVLGDMSHDNVLYHSREFNCVNPVDLHHYNAAIDYFDLPIPRILSINELIYGVEISDIIKDLGRLRVQDLRLFKEKVLEPFLKKIELEEKIKKMGKNV